VKSPIFFDRDENNEPLPIQVARTYLNLPYDGDGERSAAIAADLAKRNPAAAVTGMVSFSFGAPITLDPPGPQFFVSTDRARELANEILRAADEADGLAEPTPGKKL